MKKKPTDHFHSLQIHWHTGPLPLSPDPSYFCSEDAPTSWLLLTRATSLSSCCVGLFLVIRLFRAHQEYIAFGDI